MTDFACVTLGQTKPLPANQGLQFEKPLLSLFLMPLLTLVCTDPVSWQASSSPPANPCSGPGLPPAVVLRSSSVAPLPLFRLRVRTQKPLTTVRQSPDNTACGKALPGRTAAFQELRLESKGRCAMGEH